MLITCRIAKVPWAEIHERLAPGVPHSPIISTGIEPSSWGPISSAS